MKSEKFLDQCALLLSRIFHPFVVAVPAGLLLLYLAEINPIESLKWVSVSAGLTILPTILFMQLHPEYHLRDINSRENRNLLYLIGLAELCVLTALLWFLKAPEVITLLSCSAVLLIIIGGIINRSTKISLHVGTLSGFSAAASFLSLTTGALCFVLTLGVAWSRLRLERHNFHQVILGLAIPTLCISLVFQALI